MSKDSISDIAEMVIDPTAGPEFVEKRIRDEWESSKEGMTLLDCLNDVVVHYAQFIDSEIVWEKKRKLIAVVVELNQRIRPKQSKGKH